MPISLPKIKLKNPFKELSPEDQKILLICLGVAFVFWILVKFSKEYTVNRLVSIEYELPLDQSFTIPPPEQIGVDLIAKGWYFLLSSIIGSDLEVQYSVPEQDTYELSASQVHEDIDRILQGKNVIIEQLYFEGFKVFLEKQAIKRVPISISIDINFASEFALAKDISLNPDSVTVSGPTSRLESITSWPTDSLSLRQVNQNYKGTIGLSKPIDGLKITLKDTEVGIEVERFTEKSVFVPIQIDYPLTDSIRFFPNKILLKCAVGLGHYDSLSASDFNLTAKLDESLISEGKRTVPVALTRQPEYIQNIQFFPKVVEFLIIKK